MDYKRTYEILEIKEESPKVRSFFFNFKKAEPGQFLMVWVPGAEEIPMGVSCISENKIGISVFNVGATTKKFHSLKQGDFVGLRGPYGNAFTLKGKKIALVAGGYGASPLLCLAKNSKDKKIDIFLGAKNKNYLLFKEEFEKLGEVFYATDDGSVGYKGYVTDVFKKNLKKYDCVYTCGPEVMMKKVMDICIKKKMNMQASLERFMKCGVGLCGSCSINGYQVCKDGPVFSLKELKEFTEFGNG